MKSTKTSSSFSKVLNFEKAPKNLSLAIITIFIMNLMFGLLNEVNAQNVGVNTTGAAPDSKHLLEVLQTGTTDNSVGIYVKHSGADATKTLYGFQAIRDGVGLVNIAAYLQAINGTSNYALIVPSGGGNVGIGTTAPATNFAINTSNTPQSASTSAIIRPALEINSTGDAWIDLYGTANSGNHWRLINNNNTGDAGELVFQNAGSSKVTFLTNGNVGIGTSAPTSLLNLLGGGIRINSFDYGIGFSNETPQNGNVTTDGARIYFDNDFFGASTDALVIEKTDLNANDPDNGLAGIAFTMKGQDNIRETSLVIKGDGNVGIGTTSPAATLHVSGNVYGSNFSMSGTNGSLIYGVDPSYTDGARIKMFGSTHANVGLMTFFTSGTTERMRISSDGNVGIATVPLARLDLGPTTSANKPMFRFNASGSGATAVNYSGYAHADMLMGAYDLSGYANHYISFGYTADPGRKFHIGSGSNATFDGTTTFVPALTVNSGGNVGIGSTSPAYKLQVVGAIHASGIVYCNSAALCSDSRYKKEVKPLASSLENVLKLEGVSYLWKQEQFKENQFNNRLQIGFIAQDLEKIYPEVVETNTDGFKSVDYSKLTPILVEAIKEQQQIIEVLKVENSISKEKEKKQEHINNQLKSEISEIKAILNQQSKK